MMMERKKIEKFVMLLGVSFMVFVVVFCGYECNVGKTGKGGLLLMQNAKITDSEGEDFLMNLHDNSGSYKIMGEDDFSFPVTIRMYHTAREAANYPIMILPIMKEEEEVMMSFSFESNDKKIYYVEDGFDIENNREIRSSGNWYGIERVGEIQSFDLELSELDVKSTIIFEICFRDDESKFIAVQVLD